MATAVSAAERQAALAARIGQYVGQQYRVVSQSEYAAQLVKPKRFSALWFLLWLVLAVVPAVLYVGYHVFLKRERQVYLIVDEQGAIHETRDKR